MLRAKKKNQRRPNKDNSEVTSDMMESHDVPYGEICL